MPDSWYARRGKRLVDLLVAIPLLVVSGPALGVIALAVRWTSPGPALFRQLRLGRHAETFQALKFRTMTDKWRVPDTVSYQGDPAEITTVGRVLRRYKLDELPQLINVVRGEMSLVGPRPQLPVQLSEFDENGAMRLHVRPGLTGLAQISGGVALTWPERWYYDARYVEKLSLSTDLRIMIKTIRVLLEGEERFVRHPPVTENASPR